MIVQSQAVFYHVALRVGLSILHELIDLFSLFVSHAYKFILSFVTLHFDYLHLDIKTQRQRDGFLWWLKKLCFNSVGIFN